MKNGALYIRVSTHYQDELSPDTQKNLLLDYAAVHQITINKEHIFIEKGISGRTADNRPQFQQMIALAKQRPSPFQIILVWKFSRFARNQEESIVYKSLLRKQCNIEVISISEPITEGPFGSLIERIIEWMDEYYSTRLSQEVMRGMTEKALRGGYQSKPPLGYRIPSPGSPPVVVPEEARIIRLIFDKYVNRKMSSYEIARYLNQIGCKTSCNKSFESRSVTYILQNPLYCGLIRWNKTCSRSNSTKDDSEWILAEGIHEPIISRSMYDLAQKRLLSTRKLTVSKPSSTCHHWLCGLLKCPYCGRTMTARATCRHSGGTKYVNFSCYGYSKGKCLHPSGISSLKLSPIILGALNESLNIDNLSFSYKYDDAVFCRNEQCLLQDKLRNLKIKEQRIMQAYREGIDSLAEYSKNKKILEKERLAIHSALAELTLSGHTADKQSLSIPLSVSNICDILLSDDFDDCHKNKMLKSIIKKIVYDREAETLKIYYYLPESN